MAEKAVEKINSYIPHDLKIRKINRDGLSCKIVPLLKIVAEERELTYNEDSLKRAAGVFIDGYEKFMANGCLDENGRWVYDKDLTEIEELLYEAAESDSKAKKHKFAKTNKH